MRVLASFLFHVHISIIVHGVRPVFHVQDGADTTDNGDRSVQRHRFYGKKAGGYRHVHRPVQRQIVTSSYGKNHEFTKKLAKQGAGYRQKPLSSALVTEYESSRRGRKPKEISSSSESDAESGKSEFEKELEEHKKKADRAESHYGYLVGGALLGFLTFSMYLLYMLLSSDPQISAYSFRIVSLAIAIFLAIMLENAMDYIVVHTIVVQLLGKLSETVADEVVLITMAVLLKLSISKFCHIARESPVNLQAVKGVVMHVGVFLAINVCGSIQEQFAKYAGPEYTSQCSAYILVPCVTLVCCGVVRFLTSQYRESYPEDSHAEAHGQHAEACETESEEEPEWKEIALESEIEFSGLLVGFLMGRAIGFMTTGMIQNEEFDNGWVFVGTDQMTKLYSVWLVLFFFFFVAVRLEHHELKDYPFLGEYIECHVQFIHTWTTLIVLRLSLFALFHTFTHVYLWSTTIDAALLALGTAPIIAITLIFIDSAADRGFLGTNTTEEVIQGVSLLAGLLWEQAFHNSVVTIVTGGHGIDEEHEEHDEGFKSLQIGFFCILVVLTIYPAWKWYLLPETCKPIPLRDEVPTQAQTVEKMTPIMLEQGLMHRKIGRVFLKKGTPGETVDTIVNGKLETTSIVKEGDWILRADTASKELLVLPDEERNKLYSPDPIQGADHPDMSELTAAGFTGPFAPLGRCLALEITPAMIADHFAAGCFQDPSGESMSVETGDYLVAPTLPEGIGKPKAIIEVYRIEKDSFLQTYARE